MSSGRDHNRANPPLGILYCDDCQRPTAHVRACGGTPACGYCGAAAAPSADGGRSELFWPAQEDSEIR